MGGPIRIVFKGKYGCRIVRVASGSLFFDTTACGLPLGDGRLFYHMHCVLFSVDSLGQRLFWTLVGKFHLVFEIKTA